MIEVRIVAAFIAVVGLLGFAGAVIPAETLLWAGGAAVGIGLVVAVVPGIYFHVLFFRAFAASGSIPARWWWNPFPYTESVPEEPRRRIFRWAYVSGSGGALIVLGFVVVVLGIVQMQ